MADAEFEHTLQGQVCRFLLRPNALYGRQLLNQLKYPRRSEFDLDFEQGMQQVSLLLPHHAF